LEVRARSQLGAVLGGKYRLDALLGVGGMAAVFAATHRNGNRVALKLLHPELMLSTEALKRFLREGYVANRVEHRGTVRVLDDDRDEKTAFLVMELLEGETVASLVERSGNTLEPRRVLAIADQVLDVLTAAHDKGIVHRDIKPENLFLTHDGTLKVLDFGIARVREGSPSVTLTRTGSAFGSPAYMAPEQAAGRAREIDARADLYAVGSTMFGLLSGQFVHEAESAHEMVILTATRPARSLASLGIDFPRPIVDVVDRALAFERDARWSEARAMRRAVREAHESIYGALLPAATGRAEDVGRPSVQGPLGGDGALGGKREENEPVSATGPTAVGPPPRRAAAAEPVAEMAHTRVAPLGARKEEARTAPPTTTAPPVGPSMIRRLPIAVTSVAALIALVSMGYRWASSGRDASISPVVTPAVPPVRPTAPTAPTAETQAPAPGVTSEAVAVQPALAPAPIAPAASSTSAATASARPPAVPSLPRPNTTPAPSPAPAPRAPRKPVDPAAYR
jgi:serine/threonine-protein kinase